MSGFANLLAWLDRALERLEWTVAGLCMLVIVACTGLGVFFRYALNDPLIWANDTGIVSLTWMSFIGGSALYKQRGHIAVEVLDHVISHRVRAGLAVVLTILMGVAIAIIGWQMLTLLPLQHTKTIEALGIPRSTYGIPLAWAAASIAFSSVRQLLDGSLLKTAPNSGAEAEA